MKNLLVLDLGGRGSGDKTSSEESGLHFVWVVVYVFGVIDSRTTKDGVSSSARIK